MVSCCKFYPSLCSERAVVKVAVIGGGVAGMAVAQSLETTAEVTLFEAHARLGGHTDTHNLLVDGESFAIDSGFMAFNSENHPQFSAWLDALGVRTRPTSMSFAVDIGASGSGGAGYRAGVAQRVSPVAYGTADFGALFSCRRNLASPRFFRMLLDIGRFYQESRKLAAQRGTSLQPMASLTLGDYLAQRRYSGGFIEDHLLPLCVALWSTTAAEARRLPMEYVLEFMDKHRLLQFEGRPDWRVIEGGANRYVSAFLAAYRGGLRLSAPVLKVERNPGFVRIMTATTEERFDQVVFACHADQALGLITATPLEEQILTAFRYQTHRVLVHSDSAFMPAQRRTWSSWNVVGENLANLQTTCWLNRVQSFESSENFFVTIDPARQPTRVWAERSYMRPVLTREARYAANRRHEISGHNRSHFAGAYWGFGTQEDGFVSGVDAASALNVMPQIAASA